MRIDRTAAASAFDKALVLARSDRDLPETWMSHFQKLTTERTYSAVLATALLARCVEPRADAFVLQAKEGGAGYSARGLFTQVIFEKANLNGVPLGSIGREPHNNQPFYGHSRIQEIDRRRLRRFSIVRFDHLIACLEAANQLNPDQALMAFACFLRVRIEEPVARPMTLAQPLLNIPAVKAEIQRLVARGGDSGRRAEAVVAASLDLVFPNVHLNTKANDPSRHWPGDVVVLRPGTTIRTRTSDDVVMTAEVKERTATDGEITQFASNLSASGVRRGIYAAVAIQPTLDVRQLEEEVWRRYSVALQIVISTDVLIGWTLALTQLGLADAVATLAIRVSERLHEKESRSGLAEWSAFLNSLGSSGGAVHPLLRPRRQTSR